jgi:hypothetical protein
VQLLLGLARADTLGSGSLGTHDHILLSHLRLPQPGGTSIYIPQDKSQSQRYLTTDGQLASLSWCQAIIRARDQYFFLLEIFFRQLWVCYFVAPSLTRGRVCNLMLLQGLASAVPLESKSRGT